MNADTKEEEAREVIVMWKCYNNAIVIIVISWNVRWVIGLRRKQW